MKKIISLSLCIVIIALSTLFSGVSMAANQTRSENLLANADASAWGAYKWNNPTIYANAVLQNTNDSRYGGNAIYNYNVAFQNLYIALPTEAENDYKLSFSIKTNKIMYINIFAVTKGVDIPWNSNSEIARALTRDYKKLNGFTTSETEWTDISLDLTTLSATDVQYYMNIHFDAKGTTNAATISDLSLVKVEDETNVTPPAEPENIGWLQHQHNKEIVKTDDSHHGGESIKNSSVAYQNLYKKLEVEENSEYEVSFSIKANEVLRVEVFALENGGTPTWGNGNFLDSSNVAAYIRLSNTVPGTTETEWIELKYTFSIGETEGKDYYFLLHFGAGGSANTATISDFSLLKIDDSPTPPPVKPDNTGWLQYQHNKEIVKTDDSHHGGESIKNLNVAYQNLYKKLDVVSNCNYEISFSIKANEVIRIEVFALESDTTPIWLATGNFIDSNATLSYNMLAKNVPGTSENEWLEVKYNFAVGNTTNSTYYLNIHFGAGGDSNTAIVSDFNLVKTGEVPIDWFQHQWNSNIMKTDDSRYGGEAIKNLNVAYQNLYKKLDLKPSTAYEISFSVKANSIMRIVYFALKKDGRPAWDVNNFLDAGAVSEYSKLSDSVKGVSETDWLDFKATFITGSEENLDYYFNIHFGAKGINNDAIVSDVIVKEVAPGYLYDTELNYCEDFYNLALKTNSISGVATKRTIIEIPLKAKDFYAFGITLNGDGNAVLAFDKEGTQLVKKLNINGKRNGFRFINQLPNQSVYLILQPNTELVYDDLHLFLPLSVSTKIEMGKETNPNAEKSNVYLTDAEIDEILENPSQYQQSTSPATGDNESPSSAFIILVVTLLTVVWALYRKKSTIEAEV